MLRHILLSILRTFNKSRIQFLLVIAGLSIGITVTLLIGVYVLHETSYDKHHLNADRKFRVNTILEMEGVVDRTAKSGLNVGQALQGYFPEVIRSTQMLNVSKQTIKVGEDLYSSEQVIYVDSNFFSFFNYAMLIGNPDQALDGPNQVVLAKSIAQSYFGSLDKAMGSTLEINRKVYQVTAIFDDLGFSTHIPHKIFISLASLGDEFLNMRNREYMWITSYTYIELLNSQAIASLREKLPQFYKDHLIPYAQKNEVNGSITFELERLSSIHFNDNLRFDFPGATNPYILQIFSAIAFLTLTIALINYLNLSTAKISHRVKQIGIKKSLGATRLLLSAQFMTETLVAVLISLMIATGMAAFSLPVLYDLTGAYFDPSSFVTWKNVLYGFIGVTLFSLFVGLYPALLVTASSPLEVLRSGPKSFSSSKLKLLAPANIRKALVIAQFVISIFLVVGTIFTYRQFTFLQDYDLGFDQSNLMVIDIPSDTTVSNKLDVVRTRLLELTGVRSVSVCSSIPGSGHSALTMNVSQSGGSEIKIINAYYADDDYLNTLDASLEEGRFFSRDFSSDPQEAFVINRAAARFLGWDEPLGKLIESPMGQKGKVIGVLADFNYKSLHNTVEPLIIMNTYTSQGFLMLKLEAAQMKQLVENVGKVWRTFDPDHPYEYFFLDQQFNLQYLKEERMTKIFLCFSSLAILISCLGLIGLAIFTNEIKTKEIGIRRALGASEWTVFRSLSGGFLKLVLIANIGAWPIAFFFIQNWLSRFAYRVDMAVYPFLLGAGISFLFALLTVFFFSMKGARQSIVSALKYE